MDFSPLLKALVHQHGFAAPPEELFLGRSLSSVFFGQFQMVHCCPRLPCCNSHNAAKVLGAQSCFFGVMKSFTSIDLIVTAGVLTWRALEGVSEAPQGPSHPLKHDTAEM